MKKILVVDNHPVMLNLIANLLEKKGHEVCTAKDGLSALDILRVWMPDVVFLDLVMPNIGGEKLCQIIRKTPSLKDVFIVIVSAVAAEEGRDVTKFGANTCIAKGPFSSMAKHILEVLEESDKKTTNLFPGKILGIEEVNSREITRELLSVKDHFEVILERMSEGILELTADARVVYANPGALAIIGEPEEAVLASSFLDLFNEPDGDRIKGFFTKKLNRPEKISEDASIQLSGKDITLDFLPLKDPEKKIVVILSDVTDRKRMKAQILQAMERAEQMALKAEAANIAKSAFLAAMSHEIRTPMNAVIGFTDILLDTDLMDKQIDYANTIKQSGEVLLSLINDILDFSKVEAGQLDLESIDFDPEVTTHHTCELIRPQVAKKPIEILCRIGNDVPGYVKGDPGRFRQVLINLMSNAAKFTDAGEIELSLDVEAEEPDQVKLHATVRDTGSAIPEVKLEQIFEAFKQIDSSTTRKYGGTGLGLSICRKISRLMGGEVWGESEPGKGNVFHFTAWFEKSQIKREKAFHRVSLSGKKVLIVDDNRTNLDIIRHILESVGMQVVELTDGQAVLPTVLSAVEAGDPFEFCILDVEIEGMRGYDIAKQIRGPELQISYFPMLAFSLPIERRAKKCLEAGFDGYLPTPIRRDKLIEIMARLLGDKEKRAGQVPEMDKQNLVTQYSIQEETKRAIWILLAEDNVMSQKLAELMLTKAGYLVDVANNGKEVFDKYTSSPEKFGLIFMDIQMPEMDGLQATKGIRKWEAKLKTQSSPATLPSVRSKRVPIVALTANAMKGDRERCLEAGMDDYVAKPVQREVVFGMLRKWVITS